ncbi:MAG: hypothetical protein Q9216_005531 [Gyalolechia sp. 2 TL-2023]
MADYHESRQSEIYGGTISLIVLATLSVIVRLIARQRSAAKLWWDDFIIVVALVFAWGLSAGYWMQVRYCGLGRHTNAAGGPVGPVQLLKFYKLFLAIQLMVVAFDQVKLEDITYTLVTASIWTTIEQSIGIVCACLPTTRPLIKRFLKGVRDSGDDTLDRTLKTSTVPLSHYAARQGVHDSTDTTNDGFTGLTDKGTVGNGSVTAHASTASNDKPPVAAHTILKQQKLEQHVEHARYV